MIYLPPNPGQPYSIRQNQRGEMESSSDQNCHKHEKRIFLFEITPSSSAASFKFCDSSSNFSDSSFKFSDSSSKLTDSSSKLSDSSSKLSDSSSKLSDSLSKLSDSSSEFSDECTEKYEPFLTVNVLTNLDVIKHDFDFRDIGVLGNFSLRIGNIDSLKILCKCDEKVVRVQFVKYFKTRAEADLQYLNLLVESDCNVIKQIEYIANPNYPSAVIALAVSFLHDLIDEWPKPEGKYDDVFKSVVCCFNKVDDYDSLEMELISSLIVRLMTKQGPYKGIVARHVCGDRLLRALKTENLPTLENILTLVAAMIEIEPLAEKMIESKYFKFKYLYKAFVHTEMEPTVIYMVETISKYKNNDKIKHLFFHDGGMDFCFTILMNVIWEQYRIVALKTINNIAVGEREGEKWLLSNLPDLYKVINVEKNHDCFILELLLIIRISHEPEVFKGLTRIDIVEFFASWLSLKSDFINRLACEVLWDLLDNKWARKIYQEISLPKVANLIITNRTSWDTKHKALILLERLLDINEDYKRTIISEVEKIMVIFGRDNTPLEMAQSILAFLDDFILMDEYKSIFINKDFIVSLVGYLKDENEFMPQFFSSVIKMLLTIMGFSDEVKTWLYEIPGWLDCLYRWLANVQSVQQSLACSLLQCFIPLFASWPDRLIKMGLTNWWAELEKKNLSEKNHLKQMFSSVLDKFPELKFGYLGYLGWNNITNTGFYTTRLPRMKGNQYLIMSKHLEDISCPTEIVYTINFGSLYSDDRSDFVNWLHLPYSCVGLGAHQNKDKPSNKSCLKPSIISPDNSLGSSPITLKCSTKCADEVNSQDQRNEKDHSALPLPLPRLPEVQHSSNTIYVRMLEAVRSLYASQVSYAAEKSPKMRTHFAKQSDRICRSDIAALDAPPFTRISSILKRPQEPTRLILEQSSMTLGTSFSEDSFEGIPHSKRSVSWSSMVKSEKLTAPKRPPVTRPPKARLPTARGSPSGTLFEFQNKGTTYYDRLRRYTLLGEDPYLRKMVRDLADIFQHFTDPYGKNSRTTSDNFLLGDYFANLYNQKAANRIPRSSYGRFKTFVAKIIAIIVCKHMEGSDKNRSIRRRDIHAHLEQLKRQLKTTFIPIGCVRYGGKFERALLFKVLADKFDLKCIFQRNLSENNIGWIEIEIEQYKCTIGPKTHYIVDLIQKPGHFIPIKSVDARHYRTSEL